MTPRGPDVPIDGIDAFLVRILGDGTEPAERVADGVSSLVYRVRRGSETLYLRLAEEGEDMAPDVEVHERLRGLGVRVADIVHYEPFADEIGRSVALTTEIAGTSLIDCTDERTSRIAARAAGRDLAVLNTVETQGWGFIDGDGRPGIRGMYATRRAWVEDVIAPDGRSHLEAAIGSADLAKLDRIVRDEAERSEPDARLAHGDFDVSQIYHCDGRYAGIIDLGDMLGAEWHYDLAHFLVHDGEQNAYELLGDVLDGYREVHPVDIEPNDLVLTGVLLAVFRHTRVLARFGEGALTHPYISWMTGRIRTLVERT
jgi:aminoglycoside phosphotransferase (APT) family kinase protein